MKPPDNVSPELRKIEKEIDDCYKSNPLVNLPFATAAWSLLAYAELQTSRDVSRQLTPQEVEMMADNCINELKSPMVWLFHTCKPDGQIPFTYDRKVLQASEDLLKLGEKYQWFEEAYTYATCRMIGLKLQGSTIQPTKGFFKEMKYKAYGHLIEAHQSDEGIALTNADDFHSVTKVIRHSVRVKGDRFSYKLNPRIVSDTIKAMSPGYDIVFSLPPEWQFSRYSLGDFRGVFEAILAVASIHRIARMESIRKGCPNMAYLDSIYIPTHSELLRRVVRYSCVSTEKVLSIFDDLTYGNGGIKYLDPALQPLIKLNSNQYAVMPSLWISLSPERNLTVLLNKLPSEREIYAKLVEEKEDIMRQSIITNLSGRDFRFIDRNVPNLPDIDLAIVKESEKACLLLELKWFIAPAEPREVIHKSEEIEKGICQVLKLEQVFAGNHKLLLEKLDIDSSYRFEGVVVSQNWIGEAKVQSPEVPVIQADHLIAKLKVTESLRSTMDWLKNREYLPREGEHFKIHRFTPRIGKWHLKWYGVKPLIEDAFFPL